MGQGRFWEVRQPNSDILERQPRISERRNYLLFPGLKTVTADFATSNNRGMGHDEVGDMGNQDGFSLSDAKSC